MDKENRNEPNTVDGILREIEKKANTGEYLYRGEPERHEEAPYFGKVSSNFYREFLKDDDFDVSAEYFIHGFIKDQTIHREVYMAIYKGLTHEQKGGVESGDSNADGAL